MSKAYVITLPTGDSVEVTSDLFMREVITAELGDTPKFLFIKKDFTLDSLGVGTQFTVTGNGQKIKVIVAEPGAIVEMNSEGEIETVSGEYKQPEVHGMDFAAAELKVLAITKGQRPKKGWLQNALTFITKNAAYHPMAEITIVQKASRYWVNIGGVGMYWSTNKSHATDVADILTLRQKAHEPAESNL